MPAQVLLLLLLLLCSLVLTQHFHLLLRPGSSPADLPPLHGIRAAVGHLAHGSHSHPVPKVVRHDVRRQATSPLWLHLLMLLHHEVLLP